MLTGLCLHSSDRHINVLPSNHPTIGRKDLLIACLLDIIQALDKGTSEIPRSADAFCAACSLRISSYTNPRRCSRARLNSCRGGSGNFRPRNRNKKFTEGRQMSGMAQRDAAPASNTNFKSLSCCVHGCCLHRHEQKQAARIRDQDIAYQRLFDNGSWAVLKAMWFPHASLQRTLMPGLLA